MPPRKKVKDATGYEIPAQQIKVSDHPVSVTIAAAQHQNIDIPFCAFVLGDSHLKRVDPLGIVGSEGINTRLIDKIQTISFFVDQALEGHASHIVFLGDTYDAVNPPEFLRKAFWEAIGPAIKAGIAIRILIGNHDTTGAVSNFFGESSIMPQNVKIINSVYKEKVSYNGKNKDLVYVPYARKEMLATWFAELKASDKADILFGHFEVEGAELAPDNSKIQEGFSREDISSLADIVWLGHIHKFQEIGNITYIGSMVRCDFGEVSNHKKFGIISGSVTTFCDIPQRSMHNVIISETDSSNLYLSENIPKEYLESGVLLKFVFEGSEMWLRSIDKAAFKRRFPKAMRIVFDSKKIDADRKEAAVVTSNMIDRVYAKVKEKNKDKDHLEVGLLIAKEVAEIEL